MVVKADHDERQRVLALILEPVSTVRRKVEQVIFTNWCQRRGRLQKPVALENHTKFMEVPLTHVHGEVFAVATLKNINAKITKVVLMRSFAFTFQDLHREIGSPCRMCK